MSNPAVEHMIARAQTSSAECVEALRAAIQMQNNDPMLWFRVGEALAAAISVACALEVAERHADGVADTERPRRTGT